MEYISLTLAVISLIVSILILLYFYKNNKLLTKYLKSDNNSNSNLEEMLLKYFENTNIALKDNNDIKTTLQSIEDRINTIINVLVSRKFNPYEDSGGDLSFCFVMLDRQTNGIMVTSLHGRERTRIYSRLIESGSCKVELLYDEKETLQEALKKSKVN